MAQGQRNLQKECGFEDEGSWQGLWSRIEQNEKQNQRKTPERLAENFYG